MHACTGWAWCLAMLVALLCGACAASGSRTATCRTTDGGVAQLIADLWTPDKEVERAALDRAAVLRDERIGEALVGKMWVNVRGHGSTYYYSQLVIDALRAQGFKVILLEDSYRVVWPDGVLFDVIPYYRTDAGAE